MSLSKEELQQQYAHYEKQKTHVEQIHHQCVGILSFIKSQLEAIEKQESEKGLENGAKTYEKENELSEELHDSSGANC